MIFRILSENTFIRDIDQNKTKLLKKYKNQILHFDWRNGIKFNFKIPDYKYITLEMNRSSLFDNKQIYSFKNEGGNDIIIQCVDGDFSLLSIDDDGLISPKNIEKIKEDESVITYSSQENENDWIISDLMFCEQLFLDKNFKGGFLSNYLFALNNGEGIVINDYFIC